MQLLVTTKSSNNNKLWPWYWVAIEMKDKTRDEIVKGGEAQELNGDNDIYVEKIKTVDVVIEWRR